MYGSYTVLILWSSVLSCGHTLPIRYPSFVHQFPMCCTSDSSPSQIRVHRTSTELQQTWTYKYRTPNAWGTYKTHVYRTTSWDLFCSTSVPTFVHAQNLPPDWSNLTWWGTHFTACHQMTSIQATYANWYERIENGRLRFSSVCAIRQGVTPLYAVHSMANAVQYIKVGLLKYSMASMVHLMANVVHPSVATDVRWWHMQYAWWQMQYTQVTLLMYMMAYAVHLLAYTVHQVRLPIYMIGYAVHLMVNPVHPLTNAVHLSEAPDEHHRISLNCKCCTSKWGSWCTVYYFLYSTLDGKCSTPRGAPEVQHGLHSTLDG